MFKNKVFICYAKEDQEIAIKLYTDLKKEGLNLWFDKDHIFPGQNWEYEIRRAIKKSTFFLAIISSKSISKKGFTQKELKTAIDMLDEFPASDIFIIPVRIDDCSPIDEKLQYLHWVDIFPNYDDGLREILRILKPEISLKPYIKIESKKPKRVAHKVPILFVHGAWHGAWCWEKNFMPYFAEKDYTTYALNLRGHGNSNVPTHFRCLRIADYVADLAELVSQLPEEPVMVGHSMGGLVVQKYLEEHTAPAAVLLASVPVKGVFRAALRIALRHPLTYLKANLTWSLYPIIGTPNLTREAFFSKDISPDKLNMYFNLMQDESYFAFLDMMLFNLPKPEKVSTELFIIGAENDTIFHPYEIQETAAAYNTMPVIFKGMAHDMMLEERWQTVADRILEWIGKKGI
ncbi:alpha/beta fold hydrolase [Desulfococcaceae bacterium HSG7]|nr:alpha/beta fold hydrolase [Desulfococcaceae bacterium HSG7]